MPTIVRRILGVMLVLTVAGSALQAQAGSGTRIIGRVTDGAGGAPLEGAQVRVDGTNIGTTTGADGRYVIVRIQPGQFQLRVIRIGYLAALSPVTVRANESATIDFALTRAPYQLEGVVTTATGQTLTRELGNSIAKIDAAKLVQ